MAHLAGHAFAGVSGAAGAVCAADVAVLAVGVFAAFGANASVFAALLCALAGHTETRTEAGGGHTCAVVTE